MYIYRVMLVILSVIISLPALAQKHIEVIVGNAAGGGFDLAARILAKHMPKHIPGNPTMIVRNMTGAGTIIAANYVNNIAPKDGTTIGMYTDLMPIAKLIDMPGIQFDPKDIVWLGSITSRGTSVLLVRSDSITLKSKISVGSTGPDATSIYAKLMNDLIGTNLNIVAGYGGGTEVFLAMERGEMDGWASAIWERELAQHPDSKFRPIVQLSPKKNTAIAIPWIFDMAKSKEDKDLMQLILGSGHFFRAFSLPIGTDLKITETLRRAFSDTMNDLAFIDEFKKTGEVFVPSTYQEINEYTKSMYSIDKSITNRAKRYFQ